MQREVLNRSVTCSDGNTYEVGTPLEQIPSDNRESCQRSGWTRMEVVLEGSSESDESDQSDQTDQTNQSESDQSDQSDQTDQSNAAPAPENVQSSEQTESLVEATPLSDTDLEVRVLELLSAVGITTKEQARAHLATNRTFRTIEGIGKASDLAIRAAIE